MFDKDTVEVAAKDVRIGSVVAYNDRLYRIINSGRKAVILDPVNYGRAIPCEVGPATVVRCASSNVLQSWSE